MRPSFCHPVAIVVISGFLAAVSGQEAETVSPAEESTPEAVEPGPTASDETLELDVVELKSRGFLRGEIVGMEGGVLVIKTDFGPDQITRVNWQEISSIRTSGQHDFVLEDGSLLRGKVLRTEDGQLFLTGDDFEGEKTLPLDRVQVVDPAEKRLFEVTSHFNIGAAANDGNTETQSVNINGDLVAEIERHRWSLRGAYNYAESRDGVTARNTTGTMKYDVFLTDRLFLFANTLAEEDEFQNLNLRLAVSAGPGYQIIRRGSFEKPWLRELELYAEAGPAFFRDDSTNDQDRRFVAARWSAKLDWPLVAWPLDWFSRWPVLDWRLLSNLTLFHYHEAYPSLESHDFYITSEQGLRFNIWGGLVSTLQVNWKWNNNPVPGVERADTQYLATMGYQLKF